MQNNTKNKMDRRGFIKTTAMLGGTVVCANAVDLINGDATHGREHIDYPLNDAEYMIYSVCLQCHTACPIKVKIVEIDHIFLSIHRILIPKVLELQIVVIIASDMIQL